MEPLRGTAGEDVTVDVLPVVVFSRMFPARAGSLPEIRAYVDSCLAQSVQPGPDRATIKETVAQVLLDAAGPAAEIHVSVRILPGCVEVDVLGPRADGTDHGRTARNAPDDAGRRVDGHGRVPPGAGRDSLPLRAPGTATG